MDVIRYGSIDEYLAGAGPFLEALEAEHNLIFGIASNVQADPAQFGTPYLAAVVDGGRVVGAVMRTPPWRIILSCFDGDAAAVADAFAADLADVPLPGMVGPTDSTDAFAAAWTARTGATATLTRHERSFRLRHVIPPRAAPGHMVRASQEHRRVLAEWSQAFEEEAHTAPPGPTDHDATADRWIRGVGRTAWLWVDEGRPVSLTGVGGLTPHGIRVGPVYTPPELRGRGYASNLVAEASQLHLDGGREFVFLFTDLANPTANKIYQSIGYEPVIDIDEYAFEPA
ncbi:MAG TPA: GNAT family N-acetyltransferase [Candidatus Limnocylindrales bacterium]|nr:GNAT family N-acetyltransferase [Candidatus Limnocylindrales bacterium]